MCAILKILLFCAVDINLRASAYIFIRLKVCLLIFASAYACVCFLTLAYLAYACLHLLMPLQPASFYRLANRKRVVGFGLNDYGFFAGTGPTHKSVAQGFGCMVIAVGSIFTVVAVILQTGELPYQVCTITKALPARFSIGCIG